MRLFRRGKADTSVTVDFLDQAQSVEENLWRSCAQPYETSSQAVIVTDRTGTIQYVNEAFTALTGYTAAEVLGKTPRILKSGKHDSFFYDNMWLHLMGGNVWQGEIINRKKDGSLYVDEQVTTPVRQGDGEIGCFVSVRSDSSAKKQLEMDQVLRMEEESLPRRIEQLGERSRSAAELLTQALPLLLTLHEFGPHSTGVAFEVWHEQRVLKLVSASRGFSPQFLAGEATVPFGACLCGRAAVEGRVLICSNCYTEARHERKWLGMRAHKHYTIPVRTLDRVLAVITLYTDTDVDASERRVAFFTSAGYLLGAHMDRLNKATA